MRYTREKSSRGRGKKGKEVNLKQLNQSISPLTHVMMAAHYVSEQSNESLTSQIHRSLE